jgi:hypothetical protein
MDPNKEMTLIIRGRFGLGWADWECAIPAWLVGGFGVFEAQPATRRLQRTTQGGKLTDQLVAGIVDAGFRDSFRKFLSAFGSSLCIRLHRIRRKVCECDHLGTRSTRSHLPR